jgi:UDP-N-acetylglucosamine--N-acetylmuramyl-(pentapeptide) pyrophosphoryl-undecaprenol N-acetylglucosamine transferase
MAEAGAAAIMADKDLNDESLAGLLQDWLSSRDALQARALKARALAKPDALQRITDICLELAGAHA